MEKTDFKAKKLLTDTGKSKMQKYQELIVGQTDLWELIKYELIMLLCNAMPGALGLLLRNKLYPLILGGVGRNVTFGSHITLRHPHKIFIGDDVVIDTNCMLDAKGVGNKGIQIGNRVFIGRNTIVSCKNGDIILEDGVNIGFNSEIFSSKLTVIKKNALLAAYCYVVGGNYDMGDPEVPFNQKDGFSDKVTTVGANTWLASRVTVLDGVTVGDNSVIGAGAVVRDDIPPYSIAVGLPAKVVRSRKELNEQPQP